MSEHLDRLLQILGKPLSGTFPISTGEPEQVWRQHAMDGARSLEARGVLASLDRFGTSLGTSLQLVGSAPLHPSLATSLGHVHLLGELLRNLARPGRINQGMKSTCAITAVESFLAETTPAEYGRLLAGLVSPRGESVLAIDEKLKLDAKLLRWEKPERRSPISRLFQVSGMAFSYPDLIYRDSRDIYLRPTAGTAGDEVPATVGGVEIDRFDSFLEGVTGEKWDTASEEREKIAAMFARWCNLDDSHVPRLRSDALTIIKASARAGEPTFVTLNTALRPLAVGPSVGRRALVLPHKIRVLSVDEAAAKILYEDPLDPTIPWLEDVGMEILDHEGRCTMPIVEFEKLMLELTYKPRFWDWTTGGVPASPGPNG